MAFSDEGTATSTTSTLTFMHSQVTNQRSLGWETGAGAVKIAAWKWSVIVE